MGNKSAFMSADMVDPSIMISHAWISLPTLQYALVGSRSPDERVLIGVLRTSRIFATVTARDLVMVSKSFRLESWTTCSYDVALTKELVGQAHFIQALSRYIHEIAIGINC
jgi:hypothetical protein